MNRKKLLQIIKSAAKQKKTSLNLGDNQLRELPPGIGQLSNLTTLDLSRNKLRELPPEIGQLSSLTTLYLYENKLSELPSEIGQLSNLTSLYLHRNQLSELPPEIGQLTSLTKLDLSRNRLSKLPPEIGQLSNLISLYLYNNQLRELPPEIGQLSNLISLNLRRNPLETPPLEIASRGIKAIALYFEQLEQEGESYLYEAKLLIVGEGGAGKTSLARKIKDQTYRLQPDQATTEGIDIIQWHFSLNHSQNFRVNIWDFGGQEIYHNTHQFFLTKRSVYILVADTRKEDTDFYYWLNVVELLSNNSPLLIVKNEKQGRRRDIDESLLRGQFTNLEKTLATDLATNRGLAEILRHIKHYLANLPHVGDKIPKTWLKVRQALENDPRNYISLSDYLDLCQKNGFKRLEDKLQLSGYLHDLGVCLHFQDDVILKNTVILKPTWGTVAVYRVLDSDQVVNKLGRFTHADLAHIWREDNYATKHAELLQLMIKFQLCYKLPSRQDTYIAPQLLTESQPKYGWNQRNNLVLRYRYEFMPKGIITRLIVVLHPLMASQDYVWKNGMLLNDEDTIAEVVEYYGKREIRMRVVGSHKKELLTKITYELDKIHADYPRLKFDKLIPCNCSTCKNSQEPEFYPFEVLRKFVADGRPTIQCRTSYDKANVRSLIDDIGGQAFESDSWRRVDIDSFDLKRIRSLLTEGFSAEDLYRFCFDNPDFKSVCDSVAQASSKTKIIDQLMVYSEQKLRFGLLLALLKHHNPVQYEKYQPYYSH